MVDGPSVKGVAFRSVFASLGKLRGKAAQEAVMAALGEELRNGFTYGAIVSGGWYPIEWYKELFRAIRSSSGEGKDLVHEIGRQCTRDDMSGIYSVLAKLISPQSLFSLSQRLFSNYYSTGKVEVVESRKGYSQARWAECRAFDENMWTEILGSCVQLLEIGGAEKRARSDSPRWSRRQRHDGSRRALELGSGESRAVTFSGALARTFQRPRCRPDISIRRFCRIKQPKFLANDPHLRESSPRAKAPRIFLHLRVIAF